jgi:hypothetical protein
VKSNFVDTLLWVHQEPWQQYLMKTYGHTLLLDATHKTTKYALPVFFLAVKSNVDYQVILPVLSSKYFLICIKTINLKVFLDVNQDFFLAFPTLCPQSPPHPPA